MKIRYLKLLFSSIIITSLLSMPVNAQASYTSPMDTQASEQIQPYADDIRWVYREYKGVLQKRRWNSTTGEWVDPDWINA